jgi:hypothetical protein
MASVNLEPLKTFKLLGETVEIIELCFPVIAPETLDDGNVAERIVHFEFPF